jgi:hypothetical protein
MIERWLTLSQKMESKQQLPTRLAYPQEKIFHVLVLRLSARLFAMQASLKSYSQE